MGYQNFEIKYRYLYPLMCLVIYYFLTIMTILTFNRYLNILRLNTFVLLLILLFLFESIIRFNAGLKLNLPKLVFIVEAALLYFLLLFISGSPYSFRDWSIWIVWVLSIIAWFHVNDLTAYFNVFHVDCEKVFEKSSGRWSFDEFRRLLDYPSTWKKISRKITFVNIPLMIIWIAFREYSLLMLTGSIMILIIEVFLLALAYLDKKTIDWYIEGIKRPVMLKEGWYRFLLIMLITALIFAAVLPYNYSPLPLQTIGNWFNSIMPQISPEEMPINERPDRQIPDGVGRQEEADGVNYFHIIFFILQLILYGLFFLLVVTLVLFLLKLEFKSINNLPEFFKRFIKFSLSFIKEIFYRVKDINFAIEASRSKIKRKYQKKKEFNKESSKIRDLKLPTNLRPMVILIYNSMLKLLSIRGYSRGKSDTPYEYSRILGKQFVDISKEINQLTAFYVEVVYSNHSSIKSTATFIKRLWEKVKRGL